MTFETLTLKGRYDHRGPARSWIVTRIVALLTNPALKPSLRRAGAPAVPSGMEPTDITALLLRN